MKGKKNKSKPVATEPTSASLQQSFHADQRKLHPREKAGQFPVVGVGASSGGIESFTQLLKDLPADTGMAFVLIQHLAPDHESLLPSILSRVTSMEVFSAQTEMEVQPNRIYVIPPNTNMGIINGVLRLIPRGDKNHRPIDFFFRCLADDKSRLSIGIILSGADSDGAQGLRAISSLGGLTFVQDPATAKVAAMPLNAIAAGGTDSVLPIDKIVAELIYLSHHAFSQPNDQNSDETSAHLAEIFKILKQRTNVDFSSYKPGLISRRIKRRVLLNQSPSVAKYIEHLHQSGSEVDALFEDFLINVTSFFRDGETFEYLRTEIFPKVLAQHNLETPFRIWVAGCATGEEAYSLAIILAEVADAMRIHVRPQIFASDLSLAALDRARVATYNSSIVTDVSPERLRRFFKKIPEGYQIIPSLRAQCVFARHDVTRDPPFSRMDFVSCRNLLIYFGANKQKAVTNLLAYSLNSGGHLLLGNAETAGSSKYLVPENKARRLYQRSSNVHRSHYEMVSNEGSFAKSNLNSSERPTPTSSSELFEQSIRQVLAEHYVPVGLLVDSNMQILQFRGATGDFLEPTSGEATFNLFKMARPGVNTELRILIREAEKARKPQRKENILFRSGAGDRTISLEVIPHVSTDNTLFYLVMFDERISSKDIAAPGKPSKTVTSQDINNMQIELANTRDYLQSIIRDQDYSNEELQSANEEILSSNEELQSTNEELETAKEELQSTNEELLTLNDELGLSNKQMHEANDDLNNLHVSINIPILMVDTGLRIRRFTPSAERFLGVIATDIARPIADLRIQLSVDDLESHINDCIEFNRVKTIDVVSKADKHFQLRIRPYRTVEGRVTGAVLIFLDAPAVPGEANPRLTESLYDVGECFVFLDGSFRILEANPAFVRALNQALPDLIGQSFFELRQGAWNTPVFRAVMSDVISKGSKINDYKIKNTVLSARRIEKNGEHCILVIFDQSPLTDGPT